MSETSLLPNITTAAVQPQAMSGDGVSATSRQLTDMVEADKYAQGSVALGKRGFGLMYQKFRPGNALGGTQCYPR